MANTCANRREQILEAAERLLLHYGPNKTTVSDIAREASVAVGSVYLEFANKDAILGALSWSKFEAVLVPMRAAAAAGSYRERVRAMLQARTHGFLKQIEGGVHSADLLHCSCSGVQSAFGRFKDEQAALLVRVLREGTAAGELEVDDPEATAETILAATVILLPPWLFSLPDEKLQRLVERLPRLVADGVRSCC